jgi:hypothetical protein
VQLKEIFVLINAMLPCHAPVVGIVISCRRYRHIMPRVSIFCTCLLRVIDDLGVHVFGDFAGEAHSYSDDLSSVQTREVSEDGVGTVTGLVVYSIE